MNDGKKLLRILIIVLFAVLLYLPVSLWVLRIATGSPFDVALSGYTDETPKPELSIPQIVNGSFQTQAAAWIGEKIPLRGIYIKNYNTLQYFCFHQGNAIIGKNRSIFDNLFLNEALSIGSEYDFSLPENIEKLDRIVAHMVSVKNKLESVGKHLYVYLVPGKGEILAEDIPSAYLSMGDPDSPTALETLTKLLMETDIPCLFCEALADGIDYPAYYPSGYHWSRVYEQTVSQRLISDFSALSGKAYRNLEFVGVETRNTPFWRDADVYDLLNLWVPPFGKYYQYETAVTEPEHAEALRVMLFGDSFADGLRHDLEDEGFSDNSVIYINRDDYVQYALNSNPIPLQDDWKNLNWQFCLDTSDIVILEMDAPEIVNATFGFIQELDEYLDTYAPREDSSFPALWDASDPSEECFGFSSGLWEKESGFTWTKGQCQLKLSSASISKSGLELTYAVPQQAIQSDFGDTVRIMVNHVTVGEKTYWQETVDTLIVPADNLPPAEDGVYEIEISCSQTFSPKELGMGEDSRELGIRLMYVGGIR